MWSTTARRSMDPDIMLMDNMADIKWRKLMKCIRASAAITGTRWVIAGVFLKNMDIIPRT